MKRLVSVGSFGAKIAIVITATVGGTALVGSSVFASLTATANNISAPQSISSGTLKLTQAASGVGGLTAGFSTVLAPLAQGDSISRFVDLSNTGSLAGASITLGVVDALVSKLTTDAANGLQISVKECTVAYATVTGLCSSGTETTMLAQTSVNSVLLSTPALTVAAADFTPVTGVAHIKFVISLPSTLNETTINGALPTGTIQGLSSTLTWTFTETQRALTNTVA